MNKKNILLIFILSCKIIIYAQNTTLTLTFTAEYNNAHILLDSVLIQNLTQGTDTLLYYPDTVLVLATITGNRNKDENGFNVSKNYPNPFQNRTTVDINLERDAVANLKLYDLIGHELTYYQSLLQAGEHTFIISAGNEKVIFLSVEVNKRRKIIKMVQMGGTNISKSSIVHQNFSKSDFQYKILSNNFIWLPGDNLRCFGYASIDTNSIGGNIIEGSPTQSEIYNFNITGGNLPELTTNFVSNITPLASVSGGNITNDGGVPVISRGVCWSTAPCPTITNFKTIDSSGTGSFISNITNLNPNTTYYVRAYATNCIGTAYGNEKGFGTFPNCGVVIDIDSNFYNTVVIGSQCWMSENLKTSSYNYGGHICKSLNNTDWTNKGDSGIGAYTMYPYNQIGLNNELEVFDAYGVLYNWYTVNNGDICPYGWSLPTLSEWDTLINFLGGESIAGGKLRSTRIQPAPHPRWSMLGGCTNETGFSAFPSGNNSLGSFNYIDDYGYWWSMTEYNSSVAWGKCMRCLNTTAQNYDAPKRDGFAVRCFKSYTGALPSVTTESVSSILVNTAICGGNVTDDGGTTVTVRGICWSPYTNPNPTIADNFTIDSSGMGIYTSAIAGLHPNTTYYVRAYAINSSGTAYGNVETFKTIVNSCPGTPTVSDIDGNVYNTVQIGSRCWFLENLKATKFNDGTSVPQLTSNSDWYSNSTPGFSWYNNDSASYDSLGALYNGFAVCATYNGGKNLCPTGWRIPSDADWTAFENYLIANGYNFDGTTSGNKIAKSLASTSQWTILVGYGAVGYFQENNNNTGFSGFPGAERSTLGGFGYSGYATWWTSTANYSSGVWARFITSAANNVIRYDYEKLNGYPVRCLKN